MSHRPIESARPIGTSRNVAAPSAGQLFFSQSRSLGSDQGNYSPEMLQTIVCAELGSRRSLKGVPPLRRWVSCVLPPSRSNAPCRRLTRLLGDGANGVRQVRESGSVHLIADASRVLLADYPEIRHVEQVPPTTNSIENAADQNGLPLEARHPGSLVELGV